VTNFNSVVQRLPSRQGTEESTRKGISGTVRIDDLFVLESVDGKRLDVFKTAGGDGDGRLSTVGEDDNAIAGGVGFWLLGERLRDGGDILGVRKTVRASPSLSFCLVTDNIVDIRQYFLELSAEKLSDEGSREVEDEDLGKSPMSAHIQRTRTNTVLPFPSPKPSYSVPGRNQYRGSRSNPRRKRSWRH